MIVSGGENVFPREVEDLLADHEAIDEAAVIGVDDEKFGQRLKAFVVARSGSELDEDAVKDYIKENLARYKVPREVEFMDELPRNPTGKVLANETRARSVPSAERNAPASASASASALRQVLSRSSHGAARAATSETPTRVAAMREVRIRDTLSGEVQRARGRGPKARSGSTPAGRRPTGRSTSATPAPT